jgi:hypothetical protein
MEFPVKQASKSWNYSRDPTMIGRSMEGHFPEMSHHYAHDFVIDHIGNMANGMNYPIPCNCLEGLR